MKRLLALVGVATLAATVFVLPIGSSGAGVTATTDASVYVVHGIPGVVVDVCVGDPAALIPALEDLEPGDARGPLALPPDDYLLTLATPDTDCEEVIYSQSVAVPAGSSTIVAWSTTEGISPDLAVFPNDVSCTEPGTGRITARHAAGAAGAVNVVTGETVLVPGLEPGTQAALDVPVGTYPVEVQLASDDTTVLGPAEIPVQEGKNVIVHVVNQLQEGSELQPASAIPLILDVGVCTAPVETQPAFTG